MTMKGNHMANRSELFPHKWWQASDLPAAGLPLKISHVDRQRIGADQVEKAIVHFVDQQKSLVLNITNFDLISTALNEDDTDKWSGHAIVLYPDKTRFDGKLVQCVRTRAYAGPTKAAATPVSEVNPPPQDEAPPLGDDEETPF
jgi:hypothetical protein